MMSLRMRSRGIAVRVRTSSFGTISHTIGGACSVMSVPGYCHIVVSSRIVKGDEEVTVAFVGEGVKRLIAAYAGLERA